MDKNGTPTALITKMLIWTENSPDLARIDNAITFESFIEQCRQFNPGDTVNLFASTDPSKPDFKPVCKFTVQPEQPSVYQDLYNALVCAINPLLSPEQQAIVNVKLDEIILKHGGDCGSSLLAAQAPVTTPAVV